MTSVLWESLPLERAELDWRGRAISLGDVEVVGLSSEDTARTTCTVSIADSRVVIMKECAHFPMFEKRDEFVSLVSEFLGA